MLRPHLLIHKFVGFFVIEDFESIFHGPVNESTFGKFRPCLPRLTRLLKSLLFLQCAFLAKVLPVLPCFFLAPSLPLELEPRSVASVWKTRGGRLDGRRRNLPGGRALTPSVYHVMRSQRHIGGRQLGDQRIGSPSPLLSVLRQIPAPVGIPRLGYFRGFLSIWRFRLCFGVGLFLSEEKSLSGAESLLYKVLNLFFLLRGRLRLRVRFPFRCLWRCTFMLL
mmetsp:Transcript_21402/g.35847  ORF Transcript_21402/g.35847 Transcript_21402/m.35847 type:complete len:222 (+) Transcript_21402:112-777(+)